MGKQRQQRAATRAKERRCEPLSSTPHRPSNAPGTFLWPGGEGAPSLFDYRSAQQEQAHVPWAHHCSLTPNIHRIKRHRTAGCMGAAHSNRATPSIIHAPARGRRACLIPHLFLPARPTSKLMMMLAPCEARHRVCATHPDGPGHARDDNGGPMKRSSQNDSRCPGARGREVSWRVW